MNKPIWLKQAEHYIGLHEIYGAKHNSTILKWWISIRAPFTDDETPWCAGFVGGILEFCGLKSSRSAAARSYLKWGTRLSDPALGAIIVLSRGPTTGHVAFVAGKTKGGRLVILGGNQNDSVCYKPLGASDMDRVLGYRWPTESLSKPTYELPTIDLDSSNNTKES